MRTRSVAIFTCGALLLASCAVGPRLETRLPQVRDVPVLASLSPSESFDRGRGYLAAKQFGIAIELFKTASRDPALEADSLNGLAIAYDGIGRRDIAERYFQRALAARPGDARVTRNLAALYQRTGQPAKREALLQSASPKPSEADLPELAGTSRFSTAASNDGRRSLAIASSSPLAPRLRPLLASTDIKVKDSRQKEGPGTGSTSFICTLPGGSDVRGGQSASEMMILRMNLGEVYITSEPRGSECISERSADASEQLDSDRPLTNKEYLGLVAAYLDRLNNFQAVADISGLWKHAFWSYDDEA